MASPSFMPSVDSTLSSRSDPKMRIRSSSSDRKKRRPPRVTLTARPAAQLVVDAAAFVAFGGQHEQAACGLHLFLFLGMFRLDPGAHLVGVQVRIGGDRLEHLHLDVAAQLDVGAPAGHVGRDGDRAELAGIGHDLRFLLVLAGVQHVVRDAFLLQQLGQELGLLDARSCRQGSAGPLHGLRGSP